MFRQALGLTAPLFAAYWLVGLGYGIFATRLGLGVWFPVVTAAFVYSGSVEFILATMVLDGFRPLGVFLMAFLVGARHLFYGVSMLDRFRGAGWRKFFMIFMLSDEAFAVTYANPPPPGVDPHRFQTLVSALLIGLGVSLLALVACGAENFMLPAMGGILISLGALRRKLA